MTIRDDEINLVESSFLQVRKDTFPGKFMFSISYTSSEDFPVSIFPHPDNYEKCFGDILDPISHFVIGRIYEQVLDMSLTSPEEA